jgi:hypothetical protein
MTTFVQSFCQDLIYAVRTFRKNPGFVAIVTVSVALGIAANTTVFSMVNAMLLGDMPVREPDRLVSFDESKSKSYPDFTDYRDQAKDVFEGVGAYFPLVPVSLGGGEPERIWGQVATGNYFSLIGAQPVVGRGFLPEEDQAPGRDAVVVLSYSLWQRRFGSDAGVVGRQVIMNDRPYTVVGVAPRGFVGEIRGFVSEFWVPLSRKSQIFFKQAHNVSKKLDRGAASVDVTRKSDGPSNARVQLGSNIPDSVTLNPGCDPCPFPVPEKEAGSTSIS